MFHLKTLIHSSCKSLALTRDLMATATLLPLATCLLHSAPSVPDSPKTHPKYINSETCSKWIPSTWPHTLIPPLHSVSSPCSYLHWLSVLFSYAPQKNCLAITLRSPPTHYREPSHLHTTGQAISIISHPPGISLLSFPSLFSPLSVLHPYIHWKAKGMWCNAVSTHCHELLALTLFHFDTS